jgi:glycosyltransferase involved in cell wall biosynthesis
MGEGEELASRSRATVLPVKVDMATRQRPADGKIGVLFINSVEQPGADTFIHSLIMRALDRTRFEVHATCPRGPGGARTAALLEEVSNLHLLRSNFGPSLTGRSRFDKAVQLSASLLPTLVGFLSVARYVRKHRIEVLHATDRPRDAVSCVVLGKLTGAKSIVHVHVKYADWMGSPVRWSMRQADALVGVSKFVAGSLIDGGYGARKTHTVLNAIDPAAWDWRLDPAPVRREFGIALDAPVVACAARLFRGKGQEVLIQAIASIKDRVPGVRLLIIGRDDRQAMRTSFMDELKRLAGDLGVAEHVIFTGYREDMPALFAASDVFALPSFEEPFGLVFAEAMAMKKPVVALDAGGAPEVVEHGRSGLLSAPHDAAGLDRNLLTLLLDPDLRARMGEYGRRKVEADFTLARLGRDIEKLYLAVSSSVWRQDDVPLEHPSRSRIQS